MSRAGGAGAGTGLLVRHRDVAPDEPGAQGPAEALPVHQAAPAAAAGGGHLGGEGPHAAAPRHPPDDEERVAQLAPNGGGGRGALGGRGRGRVGESAGRAGALRVVHAFQWPE